MWPSEARTVFTQPAAGTRLEARVSRYEEQRRQTTSGYHQRSDS